MKHDTLDVHFRAFLENFSKIEVFERSIRTATENEFSRIAKNREILEQQGKLGQSMSANNMFYKTLSGVNVFYDFKTNSIDDLQADLIEHRNKHYSWLLAEAFEVFETLINATYAHIGINNPSDWPSTEFSKEPIDPSKSRDYDWFLNQAAKNRKLSKKLVCIRKKSPLLVAAEIDNSYGINFNLVLSLVETMRHIIVHDGGKVKSKELFIASVLSKAGISNLGVVGSTSIIHIENFIVKRKNGYVINMLEIPSGRALLYYSRMGTIINWLLAYGDFVVKGLSPKCADISHHQHFLPSGKLT